MTDVTAGPDPPVRAVSEIERRGGARSSPAANGAPRQIANAGTKERTECRTHVARRAGSPAARASAKHNPSGPPFGGQWLHAFLQAEPPLAQRERSNPTDGPGHVCRGPSRGGPTCGQHAHIARHTRQAPELNLGKGAGQSEAGSGVQGETRAAGTRRSEKGRAGRAEARRAEARRADTATACHRVIHTRRPGRDRSEG